MSDKLPKEWYIRITTENISAVFKWKSKTAFPRVDEKYTYVGYEGDGDIENTPCNYPKDYEEISFEQFKKYVLMEDNELEIIGYKLKTHCKQYEHAAISITGDVIAACKEYDYSRKVNINALKDAKVLDLWFEPVYKPKYSLPKINGYNGELTGNRGYIKYGCALLSVERLKVMYDNMDIWNISKNNQGVRHNRSIESITLSSGVKITFDEIKQIIEYFKNS